MTQRACSGSPLFRAFGLQVQRVDALHLGELRHPPPRTFVPGFPPHKRSVEDREEGPGTFGALGWCLISETMNRPSPPPKSVSWDEFLGKLVVATVEVVEVTEDL